MLHPFYLKALWSGFPRRWVPEILALLSAVFINPTFWCLLALTEFPKLEATFKFHQGGQLT